MKKLLIPGILFCIEKSLTAQYVYTIRADVKITNSCDTAELIIENHTQNIPGFLYNKGRGRTEFRRGLFNLTDASFLIGADTLDIGKALLAIINGPFYKQGGNSFGAAALLGTKDNHPLTFIQKGIERGRIDTSRRWLFGTTTDNGYLAQFNGDIWTTGTLYQQANVNIIPVGGVYGDARINIGSSNSAAGHGCVAIGSSMDVSGLNAVGIGWDLTVSGGVGILGSTDRGVAVGSHSYAHPYSVGLGKHARTTGSYQFVYGGPDSDSMATYNATISDIYFGSGIQRNQSVGVGLSYTINGSGIYGNNYAGGNITIAGGKGTGAGTPGSILFSTAAALGSGTTLQSLSEKARIAGNTGNFLINTSTDDGNKLLVNGIGIFTDTLKLPNIMSKTDAAKYKPVVVDANGNIFKMSDWNIATTRKSATVTGSSFTVPADIDVVFVNYASGQATITLPTGTLDRKITIKNLHTSNTVIVSGSDTNESNSIATRGAISVKYTGNS
jgi:hypothetical protein